MKYFLTIALLLTPIVTLHADERKPNVVLILIDDFGYECVTGKWQLGGDFEGPAHFGFDEYALWQLNRRPGRYKNPGLEINGKRLDYTKDEYGPDIVNDYALDFITRKKDQPFFLY